MSTENTWIIVADAARARIFTFAGANKELKHLHTLTHPESQAHEGDLRTGGKGETIESSGASSRQPDPQVSTMEKHAERFAKEISDFLHKARDQEKFGKLIIAAAPQELGRLRDNLDTPTQKLLEKTIDKNWAQHDTGKIEELLKNQI